MYSSVTDSSYANFFYNIARNPIRVRNRVALMTDANPFFAYLMGIRYIQAKDSQLPLGYQPIAEKDGIVIAEHRGVLPIAYTSTALMPQEEFEKLEFPYTLEALTRYTITGQPLEENNNGGAARTKGSICKEGITSADAFLGTSRITPVSIEKEERCCESITEEALEQAVKMIRKSKKPYLFVGGGAVISGASKELLEFVEKVQAPVADSLMGKGAFDGNHRLYTGMLGMHGTKTSNYGVSECDLLIAVGVRFSDRVTGNARKFAPHGKILQFDIDPAEINKNIVTDAHIIGDIKEILLRLNQRVAQQDHGEWIQKIMDYKEKFPLKYQQEGLSGPCLVEEIYRQTKGDAILVTEVGQHQMWAAQFYKFKQPRTLITSGGLGTMGYGLGAAIGAQMANPGKRVINIAGDGCFRMNMNEIATAVRQKLPLIQVVVNNHVLGMVRQWQTLFYEQHYSATILNDSVDFVKLAEALGAEGIRAATKEEFSKAFAKALESKMPVVIDCIIGSDDKVWPMVAPGAAISEVFSEEDIKEEENNEQSV